MKNSENPIKSAKRIMKEKFRIKTENEKIRSISVEHLRNNEGRINTFILFLVEAKTKDKINLENIEKNAGK